MFKLYFEILNALYKSFVAFLVNVIILCGCYRLNLYYLFVLCFSISNMRAFKEELDHLKTMIESMAKSSTSYTIPMKGKSILPYISGCLDS